MGCIVDTITEQLPNIKFYLLREDLKSYDELSTNEVAKVTNEILQSANIQLVGIARRQEEEDDEEIDHHQQQQQQQQQFDHLFEPDDLENDEILNSIIMNDEDLDDLFINENI